MSPAWDGDFGADDVDQVRFTETFTSGLFRHRGQARGAVSDDVIG